MTQTMEPEPAALAAVGSADEGDPPHAVLGIGYDAEVLERQAEIEELAELEMAAATAAARVGVSAAGRVLVGAVAGALAAGVRALAARAPARPDDDLGLPAGRPGAG